MKASELRLGNKVFRNNIIVTVDEQTFWDFKNFPEQYKPIPITEDWLIKLKFEKDDTGVDMYDQDYCEWYQKDFPVIGELCQSSDQKYLFNTDSDDLKIYYIHQLQNLFFALCGEELELKNEQFRKPE